MGHFEFDDSRAPLVMVRFVGDMDDAQLDDYLRLLDEKLARRQRLVVIIDALEASPRSDAQRRKQLEWVRANQAALQAYTMGVALVFQSAWVRAAVSLVLGYQSLPFPYTVVSAVDDALAWAADICAENGLRGPESIVGGPLS